ncbi:thiosulfate sulfurtransferase GlpE [Idiomarina xiamenensis]|uniref:Thiosulfate sulfurtransferase GlpE n=1 Tax=Idiomarina xiamenensis 10-D-4 TaxID=740709 RepID=K2KFR9_9GAMM|nr:thiosulfate sulfurtransferase GlpE [Idiomarina xiamenensis]EKE81509.1 thiosulfate sulfurtransferase [Idiomarina xiamenensis 10-D-4]
MSEFRRISLTEAHQSWQAEAAVIADIRDPQSFALGHIPGARPLSNATFSDFMQDVDPDQAVIVVCYHGVSSQGAAQYLINQGFENVASMDGGFTAWAQHYPEAVESQS